MQCTETIERRRTRYPARVKCLSKSEPAAGLLTGNKPISQPSQPQNLHGKGKQKLCGSVTSSPARGYSQRFQRAARRLLRFVFAHIPMKSPTDLFELVRSLTKSEKRYFKLYASKHISRPSNCVRLFDAIDRQKAYDEESIRDQFRNDRFIIQLPVQKNYLYDLVLRSLRSYNGGKTIELRLDEALEEAEILYGKGLYHQCRERLARARILAKEEEMFDHLLVILAWQVRLAYSASDTQQLVDLAAERGEVLRLAQNLNEYFALSVTLQRLEQTTGWLGSAQSKEELASLKSHPLLESVDRAASFRAKMVFHNTWDVLCALSGDREGSYRNAHRYLELLESRPEWLKENVSIHITGLSNAISACFRAEKYDEMRMFMKRLEEISTDSAEMKARIRSVMHHHMLNGYVRSGDFIEGVRHIDSVRNTIDSANGHITEDTRKALYYLMAYIAFGAGNHHEALGLLTTILNDPPSTERQDIQKAARVLSILIHFELGNNDIIPYIARSAYRYLHNREQMQDVEKIVLSVLRKLPSTAANRDRTKLLRDAREKLKLISCSGKDHGLLKYIDFASWLESKIEQRSFASVVREKAASHAVSLASAS